MLIKEEAKMISIAGSPSRFSAILRDAPKVPSGRAEKGNFLLRLVFYQEWFDRLTTNGFNSARPEGVLKFMKDASRRIAILLLLITFNLQAATINLKLTTLEGAALEQAGVGQPFLLNVIINDTSNSAQYPDLKGIDNLHVRQSGFQMNMVNGSTSVTYHYRVRIDTPGNYTLGPAQITENGSIIESRPITVTVGDSQKSSGTRAQKAAAMAPIMKLVCDKTNVYVGQKINAQLTFYTPDATTVLQTIIEPEINPGSGLVIKNKQPQPENGTEKINGTDYRFARWHLQITPTKAGNLVLPAYAAQYTSQAHGPMLAFFFHNDSKRVSSNTVPLEVQSLPPSARPPTLIGTINQIYAQINPSHARVGEGMVYTITISGSADFESIGMLPIVMPKECKWYESKKYYTPSSADFGTYTMEYIVQALEPGPIIIPAQELFYFDTSLQRYRTVNTAPINIAITGSAAPASPLPTNTSVEESAVLDPLKTINTTGPLENSAPAALSWYLFWPLIAISTLVWLLYIALTLNKDLTKKLFSLFTRKLSPYETARTQIETAYKKKQYQSYYKTMNSLFAQRLKTTPAQLNPDLIENSLIQDGLSAQAVADWRTFYAELCQFSFYKAELDTPYYEELTQKIIYWIDVLEKLPRVNL